MEVAHEKTTDYSACGPACGHWHLADRAFAASSVEEALGEIDIYNGGQELSYLSINGRSEPDLHLLQL